MSDYSEGFKDGWETAHAHLAGVSISHSRVRGFGQEVSDVGERASRAMNFPRSKKKRKLSAWQKFVKVNSKKPRFRFKSGSKKGKINLKALGVAYRKTPAGKKKR